MVTSYGMSEELGPVTIGEKAGEVFLGASLQELGSVGPSTLDLIDREVERIVGDAVEQAEGVLGDNWNAVYEIANALIEHETLSGVALEALLAPVKPTLLDLGEHQPRCTTRRRPSKRRSRGKVSSGRTAARAVLAALVALAAFPSAPRAADADLAPGAAAATAGAPFKAPARRPGRSLVLGARTEAF